jgi:4-amino-4-deoxy-L-arabinose transferase-like glycosyltransferase
MGGRWGLAGLVGVALALRLGVIAVRDPHDWLEGGDGPWYVLQGWLIAHDALPRPPSTVGPLYPMVLAAVWWVFPDQGPPADARAIAPPYLLTVRLLQAFVAVLTVGLAWALSRVLAADSRAAWVTAAGVALGPAFVIEPFMVRTETLFLALFTAALLSYTAAQRAPGVGRMVVSGALLGLAVLTRPIVMLFPGVLAVHLVARHGAGSGLRWAATLALACALTVLPWHVALYRGTGSFLPEGLGANLLSGASGDGRPMARAGLHEVERTGRGFAAEAVHRIVADPRAWVGRRARNVVEAVLQPHGTVDLGGDSVKRAAARWLGEDRSLPGAWALARTPEFLVKAALYVFHSAALVLAGLGAWAVRRRWREWLPVYLAIGYLVASYGVLTALPRYLFPATVFLWVLAGLGFTWARPVPRSNSSSSRR